MSFRTKFKIGVSYTNEEVRKEFVCSPQSGMRPSNTTNTLVLISNHIRSIYDDRWINSTLMYTGQGKKGDQELKRNNRTLAESGSNNVGLHLFEVFKENQYTYVGIVHLSDNPFQEVQNDETGKERLVWVFPLQRATNQNEYILPSFLLQERDEQVIKKLSKLSYEELHELALQSPKKPSKRLSSTQVYERNLKVSLFVKERAKGKCELCGFPAPFLNSKKQPYLETHHINWLSKDGEDTPKNTVALCPNCHRKMHIVNNAKDIEYLKSIPKK